MVLNRRVFGRKPSAATPVLAHPRPDDDGVSRIFSKSLWEGEHGDFLRSIGRSPDDPSNFLPTQELIQARHDACFAEQTRFVARVNAQMPEGTSVAPYAILPWTLWSGRYGQMLMVTCGYYPTQAWNTLLLAEDERSSFVLQLPVHPGGYHPNLVPAAETHLARFRGQLDEHQMGLGENVDLDLIHAFGNTLDRIKLEVIAMTHSMAEISVGQEVYARHLEMFGKTLGWPHAK